VAGAIFAVAGVVFFAMSQQYDIGTATAMGPGYFPALLGICLTLLGLGSIVKGILAKHYDPIDAHSIEPLILILLSIVSFALLIERAGLVVATFVSIFLACFRRALSHPIEVFAVFLVLTTFNLIVFIYAFGMTIPVFWWR
jgi:hypothetical protein